MTKNHDKIADKPGPKTRRRWLRFSLRSLLLLVLAIAAPLGWLGNEMRRARQQRNAAAELQELGWRVVYDDEYRQSPAAPEWLRNALGADVLRDVVCLSCKNSYLSDAGLAHLQRLSHLKVLNLENSSVTDAGLANLRGLGRLEFLDLTQTAVTDDGLICLRGLTQLQDLYLTGTKVTDAGLLHLRGLRQLSLLSLDRTHATDAGVRELEKLLPRVTIVRME